LTGHPLFEHGAVKDIRDNHGRTAQDIADSLNNAEILKIFKKAKTKIIFSEYNMDQILSEGLKKPQKNNPSCPQTSSKNHQSIPKPSNTRSENNNSITDNKNNANGFESPPPITPNHNQQERKHFRYFNVVWATNAAAFFFFMGISGLLSGEIDMGAGLIIFFTPFSFITAGLIGISSSWHEKPRFGRKSAIYLSIMACIGILGGLSRAMLINSINDWASQY